VLVVVSGGDNNRKIKQNKKFKWFG